MKKGKVRTCSTEKSVEYKEKLFSLLRELKEEQTVVEGIKDKRALEKMGFSDAHTINRNKGLYELAARFTGKILVLTDFDPEGEKLAKKLSELLKKTGCKVDSSNRQRLRRLFLKNKINTVEGLRNLSS
ncbi:MAG: toprim domain-containing protein [archaeon]|nr:MAG: toprim domain-containing protein [archaeon]